LPEAVGPLFGKWKEVEPLRPLSVPKEEVVGLEVVEETVAELEAGLDEYVEELTLELVEELLARKDEDEAWHTLEPATLVSPKTLIELTSQYLDRR
jgi:hypothetical protein